MNPTEQSSPDGDTLREHLLDDGFINSPDAILTPLTGGVSSDIYRVNDGDRVFVVKRALEKLRVKDEWHADLSRNQFELAYLQCVSGLLPDAVPEVLFSNAEHGYFGMEFLGQEFSNWKELLLCGVCEIRHATRAGQILGTIHRHTWGDKKIQSGFESSENFHQLRIEPYLLTTAQRHPEIAKRIRAEAQRLRRTRLCLVHGDYSPKNLLFYNDRLVVLDCEVAWFGDPAFDVAFLLNHLLLKALHLDEHRVRCIDLARAFWQAYRNELGEDLAASDVEPSLATLLPMLMLARIDGKSPAEYLGEEQKKQVVRDFTCRIVGENPEGIVAFLNHWQETLE